MKRLLFALVPALILTGVAHSQTRELTTTGQLLDRVAATVSSEPGVQGVQAVDGRPGVAARRDHDDDMGREPGDLCRRVCNADESLRTTDSGQCTVQLRNVRPGIVHDHGQRSTNHTRLDGSVCSRGTQAAAGARATARELHGIDAN